MIIGNNQELINKIFYEIISNFKNKKTKNINKSKNNKQTDFCKQLKSELLTAAKEVDLIRKNLLHYENDHFQIPPDVYSLLKILYKRTSEFNNYMLDLLESDRITPPKED
jgi:hypothetical protein